MKTFPLPNDKGWALEYVINEQPISKELREDFYDELVSENLEYKKRLEQAVREFGVRWI